MPKYTHEYVKNYIEESGDELISEKYNHSKEELNIKCCYCDEIFKCSYGKYQQGSRHTECENKELRTKKYEEMRTPRTDRKSSPTKEISCEYCHKIFKQKRSAQKVCNIECRKGLEQKKRGTGHYEKIGRMGGLISAKIQVRRSFNEIYFSELCKKVFKLVLTNEPIFDGWDCDVIIQEIKVAVSWNGIWHYKQVRNGHNLEQVQYRDKIKEKIIREKYGYDYYNIKDMGGKNKSFVINKFNNFIKYINKKYNYNIILDDYEVDMSEYKKYTIKEENKCIECNNNITKKRENQKCIECNNEEILNNSNENILNNNNEEILNNNNEEILNNNNEEILNSDKKEVNSNEKILNILNSNNEEILNSNNEEILNNNNEEILNNSNEKILNNSNEEIKKEVNKKEIKKKEVKKKEIKKKEVKKCIDCRKEITKKAKRCPACDKIKQRTCERPPLEILLEEVKKLGYVGTGKKYSVTDNSIRKWIKNYKKELEI